MSLHLNAEQGQVAPAVLLPGDPLRAQWIAENFLEDTFCYNDVRGMHGFTGTFRGKRISVQGTGMGIPSTAIYVNELINDYGVKRLIRVGSAGSYQADINLYDIVIAMAASTTSAINKTQFGYASYAPTADGKLFLQAVQMANDLDIPLTCGNVLSEDSFYKDPRDYKKWAEYGVLCVEMETAVIYTLAAKYGVRGLSILTISDSVITQENISQKARENSFRKMIDIALETSIAEL